MPETGTRRGRPKGSGIDDSDRLAAIARLIASNPQLKPTTAIKSLGVSDPSMIRRLRDKYAEISVSLADDLNGAGHAAAAPRQTAGSEHLTMPASKVDQKSDVASEPATPPTTATQHATHSATSAATPAPVAAALGRASSEASARPAEPKRVRAVAARVQPSARRVAEAAPVAAVAGKPAAPVVQAPPVAPPEVPAVAAKPVSTTTPKPKSTTPASKSKSKSKSTPPAPERIASTRAADTASTTTETAVVAAAAIVAEPPAATVARPAGTDHARLPETSKVTAPTPPAGTAANLETAAAPASTTDRPAPPRQPGAEDLLVPFFGLGIAAMSSAMAAQISFADSLARTPFVSIALRQQLAFNQWALKLMPVPRPAAKRKD